MTSVRRFLEQNGLWSERGCCLGVPVLAIVDDGSVACLRWPCQPICSEGVGGLMGERQCREMTTYQQPGRWRSAWEFCGTPRHMRDLLRGMHRQPSCPGQFLDRAQASNLGKPGRGAGRRRLPLRGAPVPGQRACGLSRGRLRHRNVERGRLEYLPKSKSRRLETGQNNRP